MNKARTPAGLVLFGAAITIRIRKARDIVIVGLLIELAVDTLRDKIKRSAPLLHLFPENFTLTELKQTCEPILGHGLGKSVFRRRIKDDARLVSPPGEFLLSSQRAAQFYRSVPGFCF